jgi:cell division protein FtsB
MHISEIIMSSRFGIVFHLLARYKYLIVIVIGVAVVGFIDDNSMLKHIEYRFQISQLKDEIKKYNDRNEASTKELKELKRNPKAIEKIARERYFMKADDEDIYVLSTDIQTDNADNSTDLVNEEIK